MDDATPFFELIIDLYLIMLRVKQSGIKYYFCVFRITLLGIEPTSLVIGEHSNHYPDGPNIIITIIIIIIIIISSSSSSSSSSI